MLPSVCMKPFIGAQHQVEILFKHLLDLPLFLSGKLWIEIVNCERRMRHPLECTGELSHNKKKILAVHGISCSALRVCLELQNLASFIDPSPVYADDRRLFMRKITVSYSFRERGSVPMIRLRGKWLHRAGFGEGQVVRVEVADGLLILTCAEDEPGTTVCENSSSAPRLTRS